MPKIATNMSTKPPEYVPSGLANTIFKQRYAYSKDESWDEACSRVARHIASAEENGNRSKWEKRFYSALRNGYFVPGGRIWYASGRPKGQLLNCFVVPTDDSREGWGKTVSDMLVISGTGGGVGINFSSIRPRGMPIGGSGNGATGSTSLMEVIDQVGDVIKAGGGRRTALMMCLDYDHGDLREFLYKKFNRVGAVDTKNPQLPKMLKEYFPDLPEASVKEILNALEEDENSAIILQHLIKYQREKILKNANVSVCVDDAFFDAIHNDEEIIMKWRGKEVDRIKATELWGILVQNAWESGEPGILNSGLANKMNNIWYHTPLVSTNPCGEIWLEPFGCCDLGSINLAKHVNEEGTDFDWVKLNDTITMGVRFLDNVLDVNIYPLAEIEKNSQDVRRIGLGVMGLAHSLVLMGRRYDDEEGREKVNELFDFIKNRAYESSTYLAAEKGPFPVFDSEKFLQSGFCSGLSLRIREKVREYGIRNCAMLTIAPTGTRSMLAATSSGIEPIFACGYKRRYFANSESTEMVELVEQIVVDPIFEELYRSGAPVDAFVSAHEVDVESHLKIQAICQKHIDNAVSKTLNIPNDYPLDKLKALLLEYAPVLKGTTVYRSGSRSNEPLVPISANEAIAHLEESAQSTLSEKDAALLEEATENNACPKGVCEIPTVTIEKEIIAPVVFRRIEDWGIISKTS